ncbi:alpha/beta hydrolase family protein [bacterium]|nr:alpha/beta hydrolase family protein [bacterium]
MKTSPTTEAHSDRRTFMSQLAAVLGSAAVGPDLSAQTASNPFTVPIPTATNRPIYDSDVGSMWPLIKKQATRAFFPYSYTRDNYTDLKVWKHVTRNRLVDLLHHTPVSWSPGATKLKETDAGDFIIEEITFSTTKDIRVPAFVLVPKNAAKRGTPAVILMHDHGGFYMWGKEKVVKLPNENKILAEYRQRYFDGQSVGADLARQGYLVVVIDMLYWGNRRYMMDGDPDSWWDRPNNLGPDQVNTFNIRASTYEHLLDRTLLAAGTTWAGISVWDDIRTVDYLWGRPEVDRSRIGCVGFSTGGMRAMMLAALDDRIKATVNACWMTSMPYQLQNTIKYTIGYSMLIPGMFRYMNFPDLAALAMPGAMMVLGGGKDNFFNQEGVKVAYELINKSFKKGGYDDRLYIQEFPTGHVFNRQMQDTAWAFLKKHLMDLV